MKKWMKVLLITAVCLAVLGIFLMVMGIVFGENPMQEIRKDVLRDGKFEYEYRIPMEEFKELDVAWVAGNVIIEPYDGDEILLHEKSASHIPEKNKLVFYRDEDSLEIRYWKGKWNVDLGDMISKDLRIQLPREMAENMEELSIDNVGAAFHLQDLKVGELEANTVSGDLKALALTAREVDFETVSGDLKAQFTVCPRLLNVDSVSGSAELVVPEESPIKAKLKSVSGNLNNEVLVYLDDKVVPAEFEMNSVSGDMTIRAWTEE